MGNVSDHNPYKHIQQERFDWHGSPICILNSFRDMPMNVHMTFLRWFGKFRAILVRDGWVILGAERQDELDATHPQVGDEGTARIRLHRLGLLTSRSLRIDFFPRAREVSTDSQDGYHF